MSAHTLAASSLHNLLNMPWNCYEAVATLNGLLGGRYKYGLQQHAVRRFTHTRWTIQTFQCHDQECTVQRIVTQCAIDLGACRSVSVSFRYPLQMQRVTQLKTASKNIRCHQVAERNLSFWNLCMKEGVATPAVTPRSIGLKVQGLKAMGRTDTAGFPMQL